MTSIPTEYGHTPAGSTVSRLLQPPTDPNHPFLPFAHPQPHSYFYPMLTQTPPSAVVAPTASFDVADDVAGLTVVMVNLYFIGQPGSSNWVLVDTGLPFSTNHIRSVARQRFGNTPPQAILLTHGHFDHIGAIQDLLHHWPDVPVYAHDMELPYLTGRSSYPPPDPTVGGGLMARLSPLYPKSPINLTGRVNPLPSDHSLPYLDGWRWIHTPGHSPGHVSFFRDIDRLLLAGDAFVTQKQESLIGVMTRHQHIHGPPMYFTCDWQAARRSVRMLADLYPLIAATGHGIPMAGQPLIRALSDLALHFDQLALPAHGRYVPYPAITDLTGVVSIPPRASDPVPKIAAACAVAALAAAAVAYSAKRRHVRDFW
jgi:glyoxylase-like metal-dependent hydrolase (beta-lactamase superfamily II)